MSKFKKVLNLLGKPQEMLMDAGASALNVPGGEDAAFNIVDAASKKLGLPENNSVVNAGKALGVAGLEMFADPLNVVPGLGQARKIAGKGVKILGGITDANKVADLNKLSKLHPEKFTPQQLSDIKATVEDFSKRGQLKQDFGKIKKLFGDE